MSLFKKKEKGPFNFQLTENQFCQVWERAAEDVKRDYQINTLSDNYNLLYRDGQFLGIPRLYGGPIYPFSTDPTKPGKGNYSWAKVVCLSKDFIIKINWGTKAPFLLSDVKTKEGYRVGANGVIYLHIDPTDAARNADLFYRRCLTQRNAERFDIEAFKDHAAEAFMAGIKGKIQEYMEKREMILSNLVGIQPNEFVHISNDLYEETKNVFLNEYGLTIRETSKNTLLGGIVVSPLEK